jgi:quercetin dioxygenase-like cupin family protein
MIFIPNSQKEGQSTSKGPSKTFVGDVYLDMIHSDNQNVIANVMFTPCARTNWHTHESGQLIRCVAGSGWICDRGDQPKRLKIGDTVGLIKVCNVPGADF